MSNSEGTRKIQVVGGLAGPVWIIGWLFTIGYAHLGSAKGFLALIVWPYFLGVALRGGGS